MAKDYMRFLAVHVISESKIVCPSKGSYITLADIRPADILPHAQQRAESPLQCCKEVQIPSV